MTPRLRHYFLWLPALALLACKQDCVVYPCPLFEAVTLTVQQLQVTVAGKSAGCNTCGNVDRRQLTIVLTPAS